MYIQNSLFCLIKLLLMRKIIIVMLIILGLTSCAKNYSRQESEVFAIENVTVSPTTITFKFRGVDKPRTYAIAACQDGDEYPVYKSGEVVEIENFRVSHVIRPTFWIAAIPAIVCLIIGFFIGVGVACEWM